MPWRAERVIADPSLNSSKIGRQPLTWLMTILSFFLPIALLLIVLAWLRVTPFGNKTFLIHDMNQMYSDMLAYLNTVVSGENNLTYTFSKNLGGDFLGIAAYYIGNPLNFLITLFPQNNLPLVITLLVLLRYGIAGLTMNLFLRKTGVLEGLDSLIFSSAYALSAYMVINSENLHYTDGVALLPLILLGLHRLLAQGRPFLYLLALAFAIWVNYYIGFMICLFVILFALHQSLVATTVLRSMSRKRLLMFFSASLLAGGLTAIRLLPALLQLTDGQKSPQTNAMNFACQFGLLDFLSRNVTAAFEDFQIKFGLPSIYCGVTLTALALLYFLNTRFSPREKFLKLAFFLMMFLSFNIRILNLIWHGGSEPIWWQYRNGFLFVFLTVWTAAECWREREGISRRVLWLIPLVLAITVGIYLKRYTYIKPGFLITDVLIMMTMVGYLSMFSERKERSIEKLGVGVLTFGILVVNAGAILTQNLSTATTVEEFEREYNRTQPYLTSLKMEDTSFYRIEKNFERTINDALQFGYNGLSHYSSTAKPAVLKFFERIGLNQTQYWTRYGQGGTAFADSLLGVKYLLWEPDSIKKGYPVLEDGAVQLLQNPNVFPIGFVTGKSAVLAEVPQNRNVFENQNRIFAALQADLSAETEMLLTPIQSKLFASENVSGTPADAPGQTHYQRLDSSQPAWLEWQITPEKDGQAYVYFITDVRKNADTAEVICDGRSLGKFLSVDRFGILPLGSISAGKTVNLRVVLLDETLTIAELLFYSENEAALVKLASSLSDRGIAMTRESSSHLVGALPALEQEGYALFSIPYEDDWKITVDGEPRPTIDVFAGLMAVPVHPGEREIDLRYVPQGTKIGRTISLVSLFVTSGWFFLKKTQPAR